jgi:4-hydroxy-tetrahydrodipicolinate synthase
MLPAIRRFPFGDSHSCVHSSNELPPHKGIAMISGKHVSRLSGYAPALPTPFDQSGNVDSAALEALCDRQIQEGATALVVCGTTGEAPTLTRTEHHAIVCIAVSVAQGRVPVIAGAGSNSTSQAIELARDAEAAGADAVLSVVPYYNKPVQAGMYAHFRAIADAVDLPIFLYDIPARTVCGLADDTVARLAECPKIIGLKDATGDVTRPLRLRSRLGPDFRLLSGDDATAFAFIGQGGNGCISVTSNVAPGLCRALYLALKHGQVLRAQQLAAAVAKLTSALFMESNPVPVKYALSSMKMMSPLVRLPLVESKSETKAEVNAALAQLREGYPDYMIGGGAGHDDRVFFFGRVQKKRSLAASS